MNFEDDVSRGRLRSETITIEREVFYFNEGHVAVVWTFPAAP